MSADGDAAIRAAVKTMDKNEKAMLLYTLRTIAGYRSKGAKTMRWREFEEWFAEYRAEKARA